ncbi:hypothetical protein ACFPL7_24160 [Dongia soli]|uniref:Uncharacterized protein n=1 Tax=Dongia soli TaxID=600628 RepID=A0ABU5EHP6_9PROT|nr:hypothetical protein [Dongia soli]MDY0885399.1 hypothetical protein [Dongia soli]
MRNSTPFCEGFTETFSFFAWACSLSEIDWTGLGFEGAKLGYLLIQLGWFHNGHRTSDDCDALLAVLAAELPDGSGTGLKQLIDAVGSNGIEYGPNGARLNSRTS